MWWSQGEGEQGGKRVRVDWDVEWMRELILLCGFDRCMLCIGNFGEDWEKVSWWRRGSGCRLGSCLCVCEERCVWVMSDGTFGRVWVVKGCTVSVGDLCGLGLGGRDVFFF